MNELPTEEVPENSWQFNTLVKVDFHKTFGLNGEGWHWMIEIQSGHPWGVAEDSFPTFQECVADFATNGTRKLIEYYQACETWADHPMVQKT